MSSHSELDAYTHHLAVLKERVRAERGANHRSGSATSSGSTGQQHQQHQHATVLSSGVNLANLLEQPSSAPPPMTYRSESAASSTHSSSYVDGSGIPPRGAAKTQEYKNYYATTTSGTNSQQPQQSHALSLSSSDPMHRQHTAPPLGAPAAQQLPSIPVPQTRVHPADQQQHSIPTQTFDSEKKSLLEAIDGSVKEQERLRQSNAELHNQQLQAQEELRRLRHRLETQEKVSAEYNSPDSAFRKKGSPERQGDGGGAVSFDLDASSSPPPPHETAAPHPNYHAHQQHGPHTAVPTGPTTLRPLATTTVASTRYQELVNEAEALSDEVTKLQKEKAEVESSCGLKLRSLRGQCDQQGVQIEELETKNTQLEEKIEELNKKIEQQDAEKEQLSKNVEGMEQYIHKLHEAVDTTQEELTLQKKRCEEREDEIKAQFQVMQTQDEAVKSMETQLGISTTATQEWEQRYTEHEAASAQLLAQAQQSGHEHHSKVSLVIQHLMTLIHVQVGANLLEEVPTLHSEPGDDGFIVRSALHDLRKALAKVQNGEPLAENDVPEEALSHTVNVASTTQLERARLEEAHICTLRQLKDESEVLLEDLQQANAAREEYQILLQDKEAENFTLNSTVKALREQIDELQQQLKEMRAADDSALSEAHSQVHESNTHLEEVSAMHRRSQMKEQELRATIDALEARVSLQEEELQNEESTRSRERAEWERKLQRAQLLIASDTSSRNQTTQPAPMCNPPPPEVLATESSKEDPVGQGDEECDVADGEGSILLIHEEDEEEPQQNHVVQQQQQSTPRRAEKNIETPMVRCPYGSREEAEHQRQRRVLVEQLQRERDVANQRVEQQRQALEKENQTTVSALKRQMQLLQHEVSARDAQATATKEEVRALKHQNHKLEEVVEQHRQVLEFVSAGHSPTAATIPVNRR